MMIAPNQPNSDRRSRPHEAEILAVGIPSLQPTRGLSIRHVETGFDAIQSLRMLRFDLVLVSGDVPDMSVWELAESVRRFWPWQRWLLVSEVLSDAEYRRACELGAAGIFESAPPVEELVRSSAGVRKRTA